MLSLTGEEDDGVLLRALVDGVDGGDVGGEAVPEAVHLHWTVALAGRVQAPEVLGVKGGLTLALGIPFKQVSL